MAEYVTAVRICYWSCLRFSCSDQAPARAMVEHLFMKMTSFDRAMYCTRTPYSLAGDELSESGTSWKENACCEWKVLIQFWGDLWENRTLFNHTTNKGYCLKDDNFFSLVFFLHLLLNEETTSALDTGGTGSGRERPTEIEP